MLNDRIIELIQERFKTPIRYPQQCEALALDIQETTGQTLGTTTLKRMLGFVNGTKSARPSSLDILAQYLGFPDYNLLIKEIGIDTDISTFGQVRSLVSANLEPGEQIQVTYAPNRLLVLSYIGDNRYLVNESRGGKLQKGDWLTISGFYEGFELVVSDVVRGEQHLGAYIAAKQGGLTGIEII